MSEEESIKCECDCCTKCILCGENPRTLEEPMCEECNTRVEIISNE